MAEGKKYDPNKDPRVAAAGKAMGEGMRRAQKARDNKTVGKAKSFNKGKQPIIPKPRKLPIWKNMPKNRTTLHSASNQDVTTKKNGH